TSRTKADSITETKNFLLIAGLHRHARHEFHLHPTMRRLSHRKALAQQTTPSEQGRSCSPTWQSPFWGSIMKSFTEQTSPTQPPPGSGTIIVKPPEQTEPKHPPSTKFPTTPER